MTIICSFNNFFCRLSLLWHLQHFLHLLTQRCMERVPLGDLCIRDTRIEQTTTYPQSRKRNSKNLTVLGRDSKHIVLSWLRENGVLWISWQLTGRQWGPTIASEKLCAPGMNSGNLCGVQNPSVYKITWEQLNCRLTIFTHKDVAHCQMLLLLQGHVNGIVGH
jgi:hypothetical protein